MSDGISIFSWSQTNNGCGGTDTHTYLEPATEIIFTFKAKGET